MSISVNTDPEFLNDLLTELRNVKAASVEELLGKLDRLREKILERG